MDLLNILFVSSFQALFFALLMLAKRHKTSPDWWLFSFFLLAFASSIEAVCTLSMYKPALNWFSLGLPLTYFQFPVFYGFIESHRRKIGWKFGFHFIPGLLALLVTISQYTILPRTEKLIIFEALPGLAVPIWVNILAFCLSFFVIPCYIYLSWKSLRKHEEYTLMRFSYSENISLSWLNRFVWVLILMGSTLLIAQILQFSVAHISPFDVLWVPFTIAVFGIIYLGVYGIRNSIVFSDLRQVEAPVQEYSNPRSLALPEELEKPTGAVLDDQLISDYKQQLLECMVSDKPYLQPKLSIKELAEIAKIPYYHLSTLLNQHLQTSFYDFVNKYRVEEFINLYQAPDGSPYTLLGVAFDAGFNSKSTFYSIFKRYKGLSPKDYFRRDQG